MDEGRAGIARTHLRQWSLSGADIRKNRKRTAISLRQRHEGKRFPEDEIYSQKEAARRISLPG
jgi:hypothetical protein